ncbi:MAG TPA: Ig-like domain-containing protein, partial [Terriglobales bacterium]|nr:Ig-like domain-containing protein [Terriglobales bacterium]
MRFLGQSIGIRQFATLVLILAGPLASVASSQTVTSFVLLVSSPNPAVVNVPVTFTAGVRTTATTAATGTMTFSANGSSLGTVDLDATGTAYLTTTFTTAGPYTIQASYSGDGTYTSAESAQLTQVINAAFVGTITNLKSSLNPSAVGDTVSFTASIQLAAPNRRNPTGNVTFCDGGTDSDCSGGSKLGTATVITFGTGEEFFHQATLSTAALSAGSHQIQAFYSGDNVFASSSSAVVTQVVQETTSPFPTTTTVTSSLNPSVAGQAVTFTAAITSVESGVPTGIVQFLDGTSVLGTAELDSTSQATFAISTLSIGTHAIQAAYGGDTNFAASSGTLSPAQQVTAPPLIPTNVAVSASDNAPTLGESITLTATVTPSSGTGIATGTVFFTVTYPDTSSASLGIVAVDQNGTASVTTSSLPPGANIITAAYSGDSSFVANSGTLALLVSPPANVPTAIDLSSTSNPSAYGQIVSFRAIVTGSGGTPSGSVHFTITSQTAVVAETTIALDDTGQAIFTASGLPTGANNVTAVYSGDATFAGSMASLTQTVSQASTTVAVVSSKNPSSFGATVTFTATVSSDTGLPATGTVAFKDGTADLGSATLDANNQAQLQVSTLGNGQHDIVAFYSGDTNFQASDSSSAPLLQVVNQASTTISLTSSSSSTSFGTTVTLTAVVKAIINDPPTGTVDFRDGTLDLGTATLDSTGTAVLMLSTLGVGTHNLTAYYGGDPNFLGSDSSSTPVAQTVTPAATTTTLVSSANPSTFGQTVMFAATVSSGGGTPTGAVSFTLASGGAILSTTTVALDAGGQAVFTATSLPAGSIAVAATYLGSSNFIPSTSTTVVQIISQAATTTALGSSQNPAMLGTAVTFTARVTAGTSAIPSGIVTFQDATSGTVVGSAALAAGQAQVTSS